MREMVEDYSRQLELRDTSIRELQNNDSNQQNEVSMLVYKENEALKQETRMQREKIVMLEEEILRISQGGQLDSNYRAL